MSSAAARKRLDGAFLRFVLVGCANTLFGFSVILFARWGLGLGDVAANAAGYGFGLLLSFALNRRFTFQHRGRTLRPFLLYLLSFALAYGVNLGVLLVAVDVAGLPSVVAQALAVGSYTVAFYLLCRRLAFA